MRVSITKYTVHIILKSMNLFCLIIESIRVGDWMLRVFSVIRRSFSSSIKRLCEKGIIYGLPEEPIEGSCCGQGCANCVWIEYGAEVLKYVYLFNKLYSRLFKVHSVLLKEFLTRFIKYIFRSAKKIPKDELKKILEEKIKDPSIRQYVLMELKIH